MKIYILTLFFSFSILLNAQEYQIVDDNNFKINGQLSLFEKKINLTETIKNFDEIRLIEMQKECGFEEKLEKGIKFYTYEKKGVSYFVYDKRADFDLIDFENFTDNFVLYKNTKISYKTTIQELKQLFPVAYKKYLKEKTKDDDGGLLQLKFNKDWDDELRIFIRKGKVVIFSYWYPC